MVFFISFTYRNRETFQKRKVLPLRGSSVSAMYIIRLHLRLRQGLAEVSQIFLRDALYYQNDAAMSNTADMTGSEPIAL
jgi:hypothetical protein